MALTTPNNIWTPDEGDDYALVTDLAATADSVQTALISRANSYVGTTSQRAAFTSLAPQGSQWADTNGNRNVWIKQGAGWVQMWPTAYPVVPVQSGTHSFTPIANTVMSANITFPTAFPRVPAVMVTVNTSAPHIVTASASNMTTTGFTLYFRRTNTTATSVMWVAVAQP